MTRKAPRVVFDTNIVVSALVFGRRLAWLRAAWASGRAIPLVCRETAGELQRVLGYPKFRLSQADVLLLLGDYLPYVEIARLPAPPPVLPAGCRDRDDIVFIQLAMVSEAEFLVSGDDDLLSIRGGAPVGILSAGEFRAILEL